MLTPPLTPDAEDTGHPATSALPLAGVKWATGSNRLPDETLEILMTDLDPKNAQQFYLSHASAVARKQIPAKKALSKDLASSGELSPPQDELEVPETVEGDGSAIDTLGKLPDPLESMTTEGHALGAIVSESCGLSDVYPTSVYPDARIDAYLFSPCGFSANGIVPASTAAEGDEFQGNKGQYFTVHVTPEPGFSYASFETNIPGHQDGRTTTEIIEHVVSIFRPGRFSVTLFEAKGRGRNDYGATNAYPETPAFQKLADPIRGYRRVDRIVHDFDDYDLVFRFYERDDWVNDKRARVGEIL
ncbi:S-adenosylmethionine decarboxylase proenzyme [Escovopsis weberi]|uniref:S-adenosylmethionine decarboxylase proenzyme n=1 Tax=Escovopsis weberi TaxID=150374 RepID=A0A0M9VRW4_ESCWE|nr:S-adenosylmethionine decarboxylase proenzyme [Escovopsis weberi]